MEEEMILELKKEDTVDVEFAIKVTDNRVPGVHVENDGGSVFGIFYTKRVGFFGKPKKFYLDSFSVAPGIKMTYEESVLAAKEFFERYLRNKILQRVYATKIVNI